MKTSAVLASLLFGSFAVAAPVDKRALIYKTEVVTETVVVYTTIYDDEVVPQATTTPAGYFYEQPEGPSSAVVSSTSSQAPAYSASASEQMASSTYVAPAPQVPTPTPTPSPVVESSAVYVAPAPASSSAAPAPVASSAVYVAPAPAASSAAPVTPTTSSADTTTGQYAGDITIYEPNGGTGACGTALQNTDMIVALSIKAFGASTYDYMTGAATNPWCGQKINMYYKGTTVSATIMDMCPGCTGDDIDLSPAAWRALTGSDEKTRYQATWSKA